MKLRSLLCGPEYYERLFAVNELKGFLFGASAVVAWVFPTASLRDTAFCAGILVILDTITGITAAVVNKVPRTSEGFARSLAKMVAYFAICIVASVAEKTFLKGTGVPATQWTLIFIVATEGYSIVENAEKITGSRVRFLRILLRRILGKLDEDVKELGKEPKHDKTNA